MAQGFPEGTKNIKNYKELKEHTLDIVLSIYILGGLWITSFFNNTFYFFLDIIPFCQSDSHGKGAKIRNLQQQQRLVIMRHSLTSERYGQTIHMLIAHMSPETPQEVVVCADVIVYMQKHITPSQNASQSSEKQFSINGRCILPRTCSWMFHPAQSS